MCIFLVYEMAMQFSICNWCIFLYTLIHHYIFLNFFIPLNIWTHDLDVGENWHLYVASCFCSQKKLGSQTLPLAFLDEAHTWFKGPNGSSCSNCSYSESHGWKLYASRVWTPGSLFLPASLARMYTGPVYILHVWQGFENLRVMWCTTIYIYIYNFQVLILYIFYFRHDWHYFVKEYVCVICGTYRFERIYRGLWSIQCMVIQILFIFYNWKTSGSLVPRSWPWSFSWSCGLRPWMSTRRAQLHSTFIDLKGYIGLIHSRFLRPWNLLFPESHTSKIDGLDWPVWRGCLVYIFTSGTSI